MQVKKRDGRLEELNIDKLHKVNVPVKTLLVGKPKPK